MAQTVSNSYSGIPRATTYISAPLKTPSKTANKTVSNRASVVNFQRPQPWVPANTVTPPLTPQHSDENLYMAMAPSAHSTQQLPLDREHLQQEEQQQQQQQQRQEEEQQLYSQPSAQQQYGQEHQWQQQQQPQQQQQSLHQYQQSAPFAEYWRAFYGYYPAYDAQSSTVTLPLNAGDLVLVHSIHDNGWADGTLLNSGIRGWFPTNYCEPFDPEPIRNLLKALTNFYDIVRSGAEGNVAVFCNQDYMRGMVAGVRYLLEKTGCLSRQAPTVLACLSLSRTRKALLSDLSMLVKIAKALQSELTATHAQPELDESCIDDMVLRAFKLVMRAVKFHDVWLQTVSEEESVDGLGSPLMTESVATSRRDSLVTTPGPVEISRRDSATLSLHHPGNSGSSPADLVGMHAGAQTGELAGQSFASNPQEQQSPPSANKRQSTMSLHGSPMYPPLHSHHRYSRNAPSLLYSRPQTSQSQTHFSFSNSRPSSFATPATASNRHSISHRISYASKLDGISRENLASERLTQAHEGLLTCLGAFIGIHVSSRTSQELLATTQECLDGTERLTQILRSIWERGYYGSESIDEIEEVMFGYVSELVDAVQGIFNALAQAADEDGMVDIEFPTGDRRQLTDAATSCIRAAGESVTKGRYVLEMIGDFEFESEKFRQSLLEGTGLASADTVMEEEDAAANVAVELPAPTNGPRDSFASMGTRAFTPRPGSAHRPLSRRLSAMAPPQPLFEPPAPPANTFWADQSRISYVQTKSNDNGSDNVSITATAVGDMTPPSERISNGSWLPPLPRLASPMVGSEWADGVAPSHHSFLKVADGTEIPIQPRSDSLRGTSLLSGSTLIGSKRGSEHSSVDVVSTRATSPEQAIALTGAAAAQEAHREAYEDEDYEDTDQQGTEAEVAEMEENMLEKTYAHELIFNKEGQITGGTLQALVERLTIADNTPEAGFVTTFFLTFRLFASPQEFAQTLLDRFACSSESSTVASPVQLRVYNVFKGWLECHWRSDADEPALELIKSFASGPLHKVLPNAGQHLLELAIKARTDLSPRTTSNMGKTSVSLSSYIAANAPLPSPSITKSQTNMLKAWRDGKAAPSIIDFEPMELARQFTLKVSSTFCGIMPEELLGAEWTKKTGSVAVNVRALSTLSTDLANLVAECILAQEDAGRRAKVIKQWVKIAKCCLDLQNYDSLIAIVCSLNSTTILRLKKTWDAVSAKTKATLTILNGAIDCSKNYSQLRGMLAAAAPPCLPFVGMYLTDLTFVDAGNPNSRTTSDGIKLINFDKHVKTARIISELQRFQIPYRFQEIAEMQTWIQDQLIRVRSNEATGQAGGQAYYRRSLLLEPRLETKIPIPSPALSQGAWSPTEEKPKGSMKDFQSMLRGVMKREQSSNNEGSRRPSIAGE